MLRLVCDECVPGPLISGLRRRVPQLDIVRAVDVGLAHTPDEQILQWAATEGRILVTRDVNTMVDSAWKRVKAGEPMPGVLVLPETFAVGRAIDAIHRIAERCTEDEMRDQVIYLRP